MNDVFKSLYPFLNNKFICISVKINCLLIYLYVFIGGEDVECDFDTISKDNTITTRYHSIDVGRLITGTYGLSSNRFSYNNEPVLQDLIKDSECHQSVEQLCLPWIQPLYEIEKNSSSGPHHACRCLSYTTKLSIDRVNEQR